MHYGWADVLRVDPVYDEVAARPRSSEECYEEQVEPPPPPAADGQRRRRRTVLGAIIGGVVGNRFGKGNGRTATTAAGVDRRRSGGQQSRATATTIARMPMAAIPRERHCRSIDNGATQRHIVAYDVEYRYRGELYTSRMNYDPGDRIRVRISVTPAE